MSRCFCCEKERKEELNQSDKLSLSECVITRRERQRSLKESLPNVNSIIRIVNKNLLRQNDSRIASSTGLLSRQRSIGEKRQIEIGTPTKLLFSADFV